jgi:hypothetical protein
MLSFILFLVAAFLITLGFWMRMKSIAVQKWPSVPGRITESKAEHSPNFTGLSLTVRYTYSVNGTPCSCNKISWSGQSGSDATAREYLRKYPAGTAVTVYYNPANPTDAVLETNLNDYWIMVILTGLGFAAFAFLLLRV